MIEMHKKCDLIIKNLSVNLGDRQILSDLNLDVLSGDRIAILGPGGSGKSTLLKAILGIVPHTKGEISLLQQSLEDLDPLQKRELLKRVSMAFQLGALFDFMTVHENIAFAVDNMTPLDQTSKDKLINDYLTRVNLPEAGSKYPSQLSGGMRRRVGICRALATKPSLALFDEPTAGLDPVTSRIVIDMIHELGKETNCTLVCVTSSVEVACSFAKKIAILKDGTIIGVGTWQELSTGEDPWIQRFLNARKYVPQED